jgi:hypothetical protein
MSAVTDFLKQQNFNSTIQILLYPYSHVDVTTSLLVWGSPVDITDFAMNKFDIDISEGLVDTSSDSGYQITDKIDLQLDNFSGFFDDVIGRFFSGFIVNNSKIVIIGSYKTFAYDYNKVLVPTTIASHTFTGLLKSASSSWSISDRVFHASVISLGNILNCEEAWYNSSYSPSMFSLTLREQLETIFLHPEYNTVPQNGSPVAGTPKTIQSLITIDKANFDSGSTWDNIALSLDPSAFQGVRFLQLLNGICFAFNVVWRIDQSNTLIIEPIKNSGTSVWDLDYSDIISIDDLSFFPLQFTQILWDYYDHTSPQYIQKMSDHDRAIAGYDLFSKTIDSGIIRNSAEDPRGNSYIQKVLYQYQNKHRQITITTKSNPELEINQLITIDHPLNTLGNNKLVISPNILWRVLSIRRKLTLAPDMQIVAVQAGTGIDANIDGS